MRVWWMLSAAVLLVGCADPMVGSWEAKDRNQCNERDEFDVDDELKGSGSLWGVNTAGACTLCKFDVELDDDGGDSYSGELDFDTCECAGDRTANVDCQVNDDGDEVECDIDWGGCLQGSQDFEKQD